MPDVLRMGIDENGLGPRLGPLVVTAVLARVDDSASALVAKKPRGALAKRLGDSKAMVSHGDVVLGEGWARAIARRAGIEAAAPDALIHAISLDSRAELTSPCPSHVVSQCWSAAGESYEAGDELTGTIERDLAKLAARGIDVLEAKTSVICTKKLNDERGAGRSRFDVDLHAMERIVLSVSERSPRAPGDLDVVCGKVGGYARYSDAFGPLAGRLHAIVQEGAARSAYKFPGIGTIAFVRDADANHLLVAMASMVGKWVREMLMARIVRFYGHSGDALHDASGYHDPVTDRFVAATALVRKKREIPDACFERAGPV